MEASSAILWLLCISLATFVFYKLWISVQNRSHASSTNSPLPPGPTPIPLLGNIFHLKGELHHALARLAAVHGPVFSLKLGATTAVVASSAACARDVLQRHDNILSAISVTDAARALHNHERSFIWLPPTSPLWRRLRSLSTTHLFSPHGLDATRAAREAKVRELVGFLRGHAGEPVHVGRAVRSGMLNLVSNVLVSEDVTDLSSHVGRVQELERMIGDILQELTKPNLSDLFPALAPLDLQGRRRRTAQRITRFFDFFDPIIDRRLKGPGGERKEDFLDVLLKLHSADQLSIQTIKSFLLVRMIVLVLYSDNQLLSLLRTSWWIMLSCVVEFSS
jgi:cytochrome P450